MKKHIHSHIPLLILAICVTFVMMALYVYMFNATSLSVSHASDARDVVATEQHDQSQSHTLFTLASTTATERDQIVSFFIPSDDIVSFITRIESLGRIASTTVTIATIDADQLSTSAPGTTGHAHAHINATGSWSQTMDFLSLLEQFPYASSLSHVKLNVNNISAKKSIWTLSADIQADIIVPMIAATSSTSSAMH